MPSSASRDDVEGDEQAVVPPHHRAALAFGDRRRRRRPRKSVMNRSREKRSALARIVAGSSRARRRAGRAPSANAVGRLVVDEHAGDAVLTTVSQRAAAAERDDRACRRPALRPARCRSLRRRAAARRRRGRYRSRISSSRRATRGTRRPGRPAVAAAPLRALARQSSAARRPAGRPRWRGRSACRAPARTRRGSWRRRRRRRWSGAIKGRIDRRIHNGRPAIIVSADPARNILRVRDKAVDPAGRRGVPARQRAP